MWELSNQKIDLLQLVEESGGGKFVVFLDALEVRFFIFNGSRLRDVDEPKGFYPSCKGVH